MMGTRLTTRRLAAQVEGRTIVRDVDLDFEPGTVTAIIGLNGSGKSTLLRAIAGISRPAAGDVFLDDVPSDVSRPDNAHARCPSSPRRTHHLVTCSCVNSSPWDVPLMDGRGTTAVRTSIASSWNH